MTNTKFLLLGLLLVPLAAMMSLQSADAEEAKVVIAANSQVATCADEDKCYIPSTITVAKGTTVTWVNEDSAGHTVTGASDPLDPGTWGSLTVGGQTFDSLFPLIKPSGGEYKFTFTETGEFPYTCQVHPHMIGKVVVVEAMAEEEEEEVHTMGGTVKVMHDGNSFDVPVSLSNGSVKSITVDADFTSVVLTLETTNANGDLMVTLPRNLVDSKADSGDDAFIVLVDGDEADFTESKTTDSARELTIPISGGTEEVEIIGTQVIPEFPFAVIAVMGAVAGLAVAVSRFRMPVRP